MFDNQGEKIMKIARIFFFIGAAASVTGAIAMIVTGIALHMLWLAIIGISYIPVMVFAFWVICLLLSGYGKLISNSDRIANSLDPRTDRRSHETGAGPAKQTRTPSAQKPSKESTKTMRKPAAEQEEPAAEQCKKPEFVEPVFVDIICPKCGETLSIPSDAIDAAETITCPYCESQFSAGNSART
jgi:hypothetical protein